MRENTVKTLKASCLALIAGCVFSFNARADVPKADSCEVQDEITINCTKNTVSFDGKEVGIASCGKDGGNPSSSLTHNDPNAKVGKPHDKSSGGGKVTVGMKIAGTTNAPGKVIHTMAPHECSELQPPSNRNISAGCVVVVCEIFKKIAACEGKKFKIEGASGGSDRGAGKGGWNNDKSIDAPAVK